MVCGVGQFTTWQSWARRLTGDGWEGASGLARLTVAETTIRPHLFVVCGTDQLRGAMLGWPGLA